MAITTDPGAGAGELFEEVERVYRRLDRSFDGVFQRADERQRERLREVLAAARDACHLAVRRPLARSEGFAAHIRCELTESDARLDRLVASRASVDQILEAGAHATKLAAALVALAGVG